MFCNEFEARIDDVLTEAGYLLSEIEDDIRDRQDELQKSITDMELKINFNLDEIQRLDEVVKRIREVQNI